MVIESNLPVVQTPSAATPQTEPLSLSLAEDEDSEADATIVVAAVPSRRE